MQKCHPIILFTNFGFFETTFFNEVIESGNANPKAISSAELDHHPRFTPVAYTQINSPTEGTRNQFSFQKAACNGHFIYANNSDLLPLLPEQRGVLFQLRALRLHRSRRDPEQVLLLGGDFLTHLWIQCQTQINQQIQQSAQTPMHVLPT